MAARERKEHKEKTNSEVRQFFFRDLSCSFAAINSAA